MASSSHNIGFDDDGFDESYEADSEEDQLEYDFDLEDANFEKENESDSTMHDENVDRCTIIVGEGVEGEDNFSGYISQSSCRSLNTGSDDDGVSYHTVNEFDCKRQMDRPIFSVGLCFEGPKNDS